MSIVVSRPDEVCRQLPPFVMVPVWVLHHPNLETIDIRLYAELASYTDGTAAERTAFPGRKRLADAIGVSTKTIDRSKSRLIQAGAITVKHQFRHGTREWTSNLYTVQMIDPAAMECDSEVGTPESPPPTCEIAQVATPESLGGVTEVATVASPMSQQNYNQENQIHTTTTTSDPRRDTVAALVAQIRSSQSWVGKPLAVRKATLKAINDELSDEFAAHLSAHPENDECAQSFVTEHWPTDETSEPDRGVGYYGPSRYDRSRDRGVDVDRSVWDAPIGAPRWRPEMDRIESLERSIRGLELEGDLSGAAELRDEVAALHLAMAS